LHAGQYRNRIAPLANSAIPCRIWKMNTEESEAAFYSTVDSYDLAILTALEQDSGLTSKELSAKVHLSRTAVVRRINNLRDRGLIGVARSEVDLEKLGFGIQAYVHVVSPSRTSFDLLDRLLERPEVLSVSVIIGDGIMIVEIAARNKTHLHRFLSWLKDYGDSTTHLVLKNHRSRIQLRDRLRMVDKFLATPDERFE